MGDYSINYEIWSRLEIYEKSTLLKKNKDWKMRNSMIHYIGWNIIEDLKIRFKNNIILKWKMISVVRPSTGLSCINSPNNETSHNLSNLETDSRDQVGTSIFSTLTGQNRTTRWIMDFGSLLDRFRLLSVRESFLNTAELYDHRFSHKKRKI